MIYLITMRAMYPACLYYEETISVSGFQKEVSGQFDVQRLLQHQSDIWIAPTTQVRKKKKDVVFDHSVVKKLFMSYGQNLVQLIEKMMDDGFAVYYSNHSSPFQFTKKHVSNQIEEFFTMSFNTNRLSSSRIYYVLSANLLYKLLEIVPEYDFYDRARYLETQQGSYNYIINSHLEIELEALLKTRSESTSSGQNITVIHRIETLFFIDEIPDNFYDADLSKLFRLGLKNIDIDKKLSDFLKTLPIKDLGLYSCKIDTLDFLTNNIIYLTLVGSLSTSQQISLLKRIKNLKSLTLTLDQPNEFIKDNLGLSCPNIVKLDTNLSLSMALSRFSNLVEFYFVNKIQRVEFEAGITKITNPRLNVIQPQDHYLIMDSESDRNLFDLCSNFPNLSTPIKISSYFLEQLSIPLPNVSNVTIICNELTLSDSLRKTAMCFPNAQFFTVKSTTRERIILGNFPHQLISLECVNCNIEENFVDSFNATDSLYSITFSGCCFEQNVISRLFNSRLAGVKKMALIDCTTYRHDNPSLTPFTIQEIYNIIKSLPQLNVLNLKDLFIDASPRLLMIEPLKKMSDLTVSVSHINDSVFSNLIMIMPLLTSLALYGKQKSDFYYLQPNALENLETLVLDEESSWSNRQLKVFMSAAPNVDKQELDEYINTNKDEDEETQSATQHLIDPDTAYDPLKTFYTEHYFWQLSDNRKPIDAFRYRINIFDHVVLSDEPVPVQEAFSMMITHADHKSLDDELLEIALVQDSAQLITTFARQIREGSILIEGQYTIPNCDQWVSLPALSTQKNIVGYNILEDDEDEDEDDTDHYIHFSFSQTNSLYYVKSSSLKKIVFYSLLQPQYRLLQDLDLNILNTISALREFQPSDLKPEPILTSINFYNFLIKNKTGACRHRAVIFKLVMDQMYPTIPTRIVTNDVHAFVEIYYKQEWFGIDLGGYPAKLNYLDETPQPASSDRLETPQINEACDEDVYFKDPILQSNFKQYHDLKYLLTLYATENQKVLFNCHNQKDLMTLQYGLQSLLKEIHIPYCYIHHPSQLDCQHQTLALNDHHIGYFTEEPQSLLYQFLKSGRGLLIINYQNFSDEQLIQFNDILDDTRQVKGLAISANISIIGLIEKKPNIIPGSDFYSRFDQITDYRDQGNMACEFQFSEEQDMPAHEFPIELYESDDWESILVGEWLPSKKGWIFYPGLLSQACLNGVTSVHIKNGPWHLASFCHFWRQLRVDGYFLCANQTFVVHSIRFRRSQGYEHKDVPLTDVQTKIHVLSAYTYGFFFHNFEVNEQSLVSLPGFIDQADTVLSILITETISQPQWARFIDKIHEKNLSLNIQFAPDVHCDFLDRPTKIQRLELNNTTLIHTNDIDGYLSTLTDQVILDVSECDASDLVRSIQINFHNEGAPFIFSMQKGFIDNCLEKGQSVVLKGHFKKPLVYGLLPFLLEDHPKVFLVFENKEDLDFFKPVEFHIDKKTLLEKQLSLEVLPDFINLDEPYVTCIARYQYWQRTRDPETDNNWQGLSQLRIEHKIPEAVDSQGSMVYRRSIIDNVLITQPYVFIAGLSGVGKTTFIQENLLKAGEKLFIGKERMTDWLSATTTDNLFLFLFLDEANLNPTDWSVFEGLFLKKPAIFHDRSYYHLSEKHKVIFAGNPLSYGGERQLSNLFKKYGNSIVFRPLSKQFVENIVLEPIIKTSPWAKLQIAWIYGELCKHSTLEVLITPREIKTLALFSFLANKQQIVNTLFKNMQLLLENSLPQESMDFILETMELKRLNFIETEAYLDEQHVWGESHSRALFMIKQFLNLHLYRKENDQSLNEDQKYGGLSGVVLEGEPGLGKTKLIEIMLKNNSITPVRISASASVEKKRAMLYSAFNEGRVVWIDELNSGPLLEQELNAYLSGRDLRGELPSKPGFLFIATQNPCEMQGRRALSPALLRRVVMLRIKHYTVNEMLQILNRMGMVKKEAKSLVENYQDKKTDYHLTFRDLLKTAKAILRKTPTESKKRSLGNESFFSSQKTRVINDAQGTDFDTEDMAVQMFPAASFVT